MTRPRVTLSSGDDRSGEPPPDEVVRGRADLVRVLDRLMHGESLVVALPVDDDERATALDELGRVADLVQPHVRPGPAPADEPIDPVAVQVLDLLASGVTVADAARRLHLSTRSAHRRLAAARAALGVDSTTEAVRRTRAARPGAGDEVTPGP